MNSPDPSIIPDLYLLAADTARARAYVDVMRRNGIMPSRAILLSSGSAPAASVKPQPTLLFDNVTPLVDTLSACSIPFKFFPTSDVNAPEVCEELNALPSGVVVFAPAAGLLAKTALFAAGHSLLHVHPGRLPEYRGSTPMYYSLIAEGKLCVSAIFLAPEIDVGPVLMQREFALPSDLSSIDSSYDPFIRAVVLCDILRTKRDGSSFKPNPQATSGTTYHVIHPVLKHIALLGHTTAPNLQGSE